MRLGFLLGILSIVLLNLPAQAGCRYEANRNAEITADKITKVRVIALAGDLVVQGVEGNSINVMGKACAKSKTILSGIQLVTKKEGDTAIIEATIPTGSNGMLDMEVRLPKHLHLIVLDSSGDVGIEGVHSVNITDSSGDIEIERIASDLVVEGDSSGEIKLEQIGGRVDIMQDSSGDIEIDQVQSHVKIVQDSSGDIRIQNIKGDVEVSNDSSGDIRIAQVSGGVVVVQDSSGEIVIKQVGKSVLIGKDSSGDIRVSDVKGDFTVENDSAGKIVHHKVAGKINL